MLTVIVFWVGWSFAFLLGYVVAVLFNNLHRG